MPAVVEPRSAIPPLRGRLEGLGARSHSQSQLVESLPTASSGIYETMKRRAMPGRVAGFPPQRDEPGRLCPNPASASIAASDARAASHVQTPEQIRSD